MLQIVSGLGGYVKQYEVALNQLTKLQFIKHHYTGSIQSITKKQSNTGGAYIEKRSNAYFIRGIGQVKSLADIEKIVIKSVNNIPLLVRDVALVQFGSATRYGAITRNGEGEVVAGITIDVER